MTHKPKLIVQKYGGATLATPQKIREVAERISRLSQSGVKVVAAVSAMGKTTDQLIELANSVSAHPSRREMDMLLTTGERVSMALLSMALQDLNCSAISFTGSQAGILTDDSHINAKIIDVKASRVEEALAQNKVVVLAGFQGVSPVSKEITTLGRGGTDTTAVAMAAYLKADRCEILKDVAGVFTADPHLVPHAKPLREITYQQMMEMTFWGAKVLHYRSVELAKHKNVTLYIGPASSNLAEGTLIKNGESTMYETSKVLSLNSHEQIVNLRVETLNSDSAVEILKSELAKLEIAMPQILLIESSGSNVQLYITGPKENIAAILKQKTSFSKTQVSPERLCSVTATCSGVATSEITESVLKKLSSKKIIPKKVFLSALSVSLLIEETQRAEALSALHELI